MVKSSCNQEVPSSISGSEQWEFSLVEHYSTVLTGCVAVFQWPLSMFKFVIQHLFIATGFHGLHVITETIFILTCLILSSVLSLEKASPLY